MTGMQKFSVGLVQMACSANPRENLEKAEAKVEEAAQAGARVVCLPELFKSRYFCQREDPAVFDLSEPVPGPTTEALSRAARRHGVAVVAPVFERRAPGLYHNSAAVIDSDGRIVGLYRKMHIPDDPAYYEKFYFTPGDLGFPAFDTAAGRIATLICWDQWYPEGARLAALAGASVLFYPTAIGWHPHEKAEHGAAQRDAWRTVQRGHAIANGLYVAAVNRVGYEALHPRPLPPGEGEDAPHPRPLPPGEGEETPEGGGVGIEFWGTSFVADPQGVIVAEASLDREEVLVAAIDPERIEDVRRNWPFLRDRRIDAYSGITRRFLDEDPSGKRRDGN
jgi:N-carbamoylputrescine amidase